MSNIDKIKAELHEMGICPRRVEFPQGGDTLVFPYRVDVGRHAGETFDVGISQPDGGYPEYPPHFFHVCGRHPDDNPLVNLPDGSLRDTPNVEGKTWCSYSVPPKDLWDRVCRKDMKTYLESHVRRLWDQA